MLIKLTNFKNETILIGTESIIDAKEHIITQSTGQKILCTKIQSRGGMVETNYVLEGVDEIWDMVEKKLVVS